MGRSGRLPSALSGLGLTVTMLAGCTESPGETYGCAVRVNETALGPLPNGVTVQAAHDVCDEPGLTHRTAVLAQRGATPEAVRDRLIATLRDRGWTPAGSVAPGLVTFHHDHLSATVATAEDAIVAPNGGAEPSERLVRGTVVVFLEAFHAD